MAVFIAGATRIFFPSSFQSHARKTHVTRVSLSPFASFASVLALHGAMRKTSAHRLRSMCATGSPTVPHARHSSSSAKTSSGGSGRSAGATNRRAASVRTTFTRSFASGGSPGSFLEEPPGRSSRSFATSSGALMEATDPVRPRRTLRVGALDAPPPGPERLAPAGGRAGGDIGPGRRYPLSLPSTVAWPYFSTRARRRAFSACALALFSRDL